MWEEELRTEFLIGEQLRVIANDVSDLELQRVSIEGQWQALRKLEQDELRARVKLSMYASVTSEIPFMGYL